MRVLLMHPDRDFEPKEALPPKAGDVTQDLGLETVLKAMAGDNPFLMAVARTALLTAPRNDMETVLYRQEIIKDCLARPAVVREVYALAVEALERKRKNYWGYLTRYPTGILNGSADLLELLVDILGKLKGIADAHSSEFASKGFTSFFSMLQEELNDAYFATVQKHLRELKFTGGMLLSAELGSGNGSTNYVLRKPQHARSKWFERMLHRDTAALTFRIDERDEAGARAVAEMRNQGANLVANAVAQATDHVVAFFEMLATELAFYVGCLSLYGRLGTIAAPVCLPAGTPAGTRAFHFTGLYDVALALSMERSVVTNSIDADGRSLIVITGANQGGKSSFLRSVGLAQLMMQSGMFVGANSLTAELCTGLFTHYKREEDVTMQKGKLDEELSRLSDIADAITPNAMLLLNESFAATNEREGSEIARQVVCALLEKHVKIVFVTHLYDFAHAFFSRSVRDALFLRAERLPDGTRTFRVTPGEPLETSYGEDVYRTIFGAPVDSAQ